MDPVSLGLPHREPFVFIDDVASSEAGFAIGTKRFTGDEAFFAGHFPDDPIVPGVILTEAMAQLAGIAGANEEPGSRFLLSAIRQMKFHRAVRPGELIELSARRTGTMSGLVLFETHAAVDGQTVAEGSVVLTRVD